MRFIAYTLAVLALIGVLVAGGAWIWLQQGLTQPVSIPEGTLVYIKPGSSVNAIARQLHAEGYIRDPLVFRIAARLQRTGGGLKAGEYALPQNLSIHDAIALLQSGKTYQRRITIAEGLMSFEIINILNTAPAMSGDITVIPPEGSLLPDTYHYTYDTPRQALVNRMQRNMRDTLEELWAQRQQDLPLKTPEEALTLASIVEKETGVAAERPKVAGVFINRLRVGMPLQSDPTTIYALTQGKARLDRPLYRKDLNIESPYNTYFTRGLPPGPIANPGRESIAAVLMPESHGYYYFVADGTGGHAFGQTLQDHNSNVGRWRTLQKKAAP